MIIADNVKEVNTKKYYKWIAAMTAMASMTIMLIVSGLFLAGQNNLMRSDLGMQYVPFIKELMRNIKAGENILYSWSSGLGMNTAISNAYYTYNPFNILYLLFYNADESLLMAIIIIIKTGLNALCFQLYVSKVHGEDGINSVIFAVAFACCAFQTGYGTINVIWLDAMFILPLVCIAVHNLVTKQKYKMLILCFAYIFVVQFYMGYIIGLFSAVYLVMTMILEGTFKDKKKCSQTFIRYAGSGIVAVLIAGCVWVPVVYALRGSTTVELEEFNQIVINLLDVINQMFWGESGNFGGIYPYHYCGIAVMLLIPLYFCTKEIEIKEKLVYGIVFALLLISGICLPLYKIWHGFDVPNGFIFRYSYITSFIMCVMAIKASKHIENVKAVWACVLFVILIGLYVFELFAQTKSQPEYTANTWDRALINALLIAIWIAIALLTNKLKDNTAAIIKWFCVFLMSIETISNGYLYQTSEICELTTTNKYVYNMYKEQTGYILDNIDEEQGFYRVNYLNDFIINSGAQFGYKGVSYFSTSENVSTRQTLGKLGIYGSIKSMFGYGMTPVTYMLLGVKDIILGDIEYSEDTGVMDMNLKSMEYSRALTLGYMVDDSFADYNELSDNPFENCNSMLTAMCGERLQPFNRIEDSRVTAQGYGITVDEIDRDGNKYQISLSEEVPLEEAYFDYRIDGDNDRQIYSYIQNKRSNSVKGSFLYDGGYENIFYNYGKLSMSYIREMQYDEAGDYLRIVPHKASNTQKFADIYFYEYDDEECQRAYEALADNQLYIVNYGDGYVNGAVEVTGNKKVLFLSIPYDTGWKLKVNGYDYPVTPLLNNAFVGVELPEEGLYTIELKYVVPGLGVGVGMTLTGLMILCLLVLLGSKENNANVS